MSEKLRRTIHPETRILDGKAGVVEYVASDESVDSYREVIRASGWRFSMFAKNAPFVDSHEYDSVAKLLGKVVDFKVDGGRLVETVQWAVDVPENALAQLGWKMTEAGYLKAVSVGFWPKKVVTQYDKDRKEYDAQVADLGLDKANGPRAIYVEQEQVELSAVVIGANPNALSRAYMENVISEADALLWLRSQSVRERVEMEREQPFARPTDPDAAAQAHSLARESFLEHLCRINRRMN